MEAKAKAKGKFEKTFTTLSAVGAESKKHVHQIKIHTELLFATFVGLVIITVIQGMEVWKGDVLPSLSSYYVSKNHPERHPHQGKSFVSVLHDHPQTVILRLILLFHLTLFIDLFFRWFFLVQMRSINVIRLLKMILILSFLLQCGTLGLRCYLLFDRITLWSIFGLLLTLTAILFTIASFVELSGYYRNNQVIAFFYRKFQKKKFGNDWQIEKNFDSRNSQQTPTTSNNSLELFKIPFHIVNQPTNHAPTQHSPPFSYSSNTASSSSNITNQNSSNNRQIINFSELSSNNASSSQSNNIQYAIEKKDY
jgi:hypothetical protein